MDARIRLGQRIGRGGMAEVFAAQLVGPAGFEKDVAVKRLLPRFSSDPTFLERFLNEARLAARLSHPNIVQIFELGHDGNDHYIVMEAVRGTSLRGLLARLLERGGRVPPPVAAYIGASLCAGLAHAHDQHRVIHRDVSPHNVLLSFDGAVKLIDFGIARARSDERLTQVGQVIGKRRYMSPEQMAGQPLDGRSDLFPAGIILYEMLTGIHPFDETNARAEAEVSDRIRSGDRDPLRDVAPDVDKPLADVVERALEIHPSRRFANAREMGRALAATKVGGAADLEELLRHVFGDETKLPWPVESPRRDGAEHTATGAVAAAGIGAASAPATQWAINEITISSDISDDRSLSARSATGSVPLIHAVTDPSRPAPPFKRIGVDELPDVTEPDGTRLRGDRRTLMAAGAGVIVVVAGAFLLWPRRKKTPATTSDAGSVSSEPMSDAGSRVTITNDSVDAHDINDVRVDAGQAVAIEDDDELEDGSLDIASDNDGDDGDGDGDDDGGARIGRRLARRRPKTNQPRGKLTVETRPWTHVRVDGRRVGTTPLAIDVAIGRHRITLENEENGIRRDVDVNITQEEPTVLRLDLRK